MVAMMPPRRCTVCRGLVVGRCACRKPWMQARPVDRIRGRKLQQMRLDLFTRQPLCALCQTMTPPRITIATIRDHIVPLAEGGRDDDSNAQPLCDACSDAKSQAESKRGQRRSEATR